jgi:O-antigen ligase
MLFAGSRDFKKVLTYTLIFITGFSILYLTGLRTAISGTILFSFAGVIRQFYRKEITLNHLYGFILMIICVVSLIVFTPKQFETEIRFENLLQFEELKFSGEASILNRVESYKLSWQMFQERPVFGWGLGSFNGFKNIKWTTIQKYPHNILLELLAETGVVGCLLFLFLCYLIIKKIFRDKSMMLNQNLSLRFFLLLTFIFSLFMAMFSKDVSSQSFLWLYLIFL